ncbi:Bor family protein [Dongshaea marina]|uniref:Bor family protein n=1 Tax=Dongshaea marina TaxID=2047966 RepID=UPI000D3EAD7E|nr:Bor family protein [Dongshaea marina]
MKKLIMVIAIIALSGCATQTFVVNDEAVKTPTQEKMQSFWVSGIGQTQMTNAAKVCGGADKVAKVEARLNFVDGLIGFVTLGIYTPRTAKVYCKV